VADEVLAPVLREAVTNILRHTAATACTIELNCDGLALRLQISNDGVTGCPDRPGPAANDAGHGLVKALSRQKPAGRS
jgi:two-component system, NarL family, sensor histidine kinase DesK